MDRIQHLSSNQILGLDQSTKKVFPVTDLLLTSLNAGPGKLELGVSTLHPFLGV